MTSSLWAAPPPTQICLGGWRRGTFVIGALWRLTWAAKRWVEMLFSIQCQPLWSQPCTCFEVVLDVSGEKQAMSLCFRAGFHNLGHREGEHDASWGEPSAGTFRVLSAANKNREVKQSRQTQRLFMASNVRRCTLSQQKAWFICRVSAKNDTDLK